MRGIRPDPVRLENFLLDSLRTNEAQKIDRLFQVPSCNNDALTTHVVQLLGRQRISSRLVTDEAGKRRRFVHIGRQSRCQWHQTVDHHSSTARIDQIGTRGGFYYWVQDYVGKARLFKKIGYGPSYSPRAQHSDMNCRNCEIPTEFIECFQ